MQTLANQGADSRLILEAIINALISKLSQCSILKTHDHLHPIPDSQPDLSLPDYQIFHTCTHNYLVEYLTPIQRGIQPRIKADYQVIFE